MIEITCIIVLALMVWYINNYVVNGLDKRLIFVKTIPLILIIITVSMVLFKIVMPDAVNNGNVLTVFDLIKDVTFIVIGYLFTKKEDKEE